MISIQNVGDSINVIPDFPEKGIMFRDISSLLKDPKLFNFSITEMTKIISHLNIDYVVGIEARGFLFTGIAKELNCGFAMIRKPNKLPNYISVEYTKEYSTKEVLTITEGIIPAGSDVLLTCYWRYVFGSN